MDLKSVAEALVEACRTQKEAALLETHYHNDAVSVEAADFSGMGRETKGIDGIKGKHAWWDANFEVHGGDVQGPFLHGDDRFAVLFEIDATEKASGQRMPMKEVAIYHVADGKIIREEFFGTIGRLKHTSKPGRLSDKVKVPPRASATAVAIGKPSPLPVLGETWPNLDSAVS